MIKLNSPRSLTCKCVLFFLSFLSIINLEAGILTYTNSLTVGGSPNFQLNAIDSVNDGLPSSNTYGNMQGIVTLGINWDQMSFNSTYPANVGYIVEVYVLVKGWNPAGSMIVNTTETLKVHYNPLVNTTELDRSTYSCTGVRRLHATITGIKVNGVPKLSTSDILPNNIYLKADVIVERYSAFNTATTPACTLSVSSSYDDQLIVNWSSMSGAEDYDIEWTFVDQYATPQSYDFVNNSSRVTIPATLTSYKLPLLYPSGNVIVRIRGRGRDLSASPYDKPTYGNWSISDSASVITAGSSAHSFSGVEVLKNWQYTSTFAEDGKRKEVISYYDGTLRNRQSVTRLNTDNVALIGQTVYDHAGRPAIQTLPVPDQATGSGYSQAKLQYRNDFNQDDSTNNYTFNDFDLSATDCNIITSSMKTSSGSSKYYSSSNPLKSTIPGNIYNYLPDASGYAFTQVEYMPDNTNRIRRQGGVGINHRLTGKDEDNNDMVGKETKYYYATPFQIQLDRLFGNEVGFYKHYKKNAVIDANGQVSISYLDPYGRVVATALAGDTTNTPNLSALTSANTSTLLEVDLIDQMQVSYQDMSITAVSTHMVTTAGTHSFSYTVATPSYNYCLPAEWCFDCVYDLTISVKDECGNELVADSIGTQMVGAIDTICDSITFVLNPAPLDLSLSVGTYVISKKLRINQESLEYYTDMFLANSPCILPIDSFIAEEMSKIDTMECYGGCAECLERLGDYADHNVDSLQYDPNYDYLTEAEYDEAVAKCNKLCEVKTPCDILYEQMKHDVSPGGQYAKYENDYTVTDDFSLLLMTGGYLDSNYTDVSVYHNFDGSASYVYVDNVQFDPANLTVELFVQNWQPSWAEDMVQYHPEYCYYEHCLANEDSYIYDVNMMNTPTFAAANDSGFVNPIGSNTDTSHFHIEHKDPFFSPYSGGLYTIMDNKLDSFATTPSVIDLWGFIDYIQDNHMNANCGTNGCWSDYDWSMFRSGYLSKKQAIWKMEVESLSTCSLCTCPNFGTAPSNPFTDGIKLPRYVFDAFGSLANDSLTGNDINIDPSSSSPQDIAEEAAGFIEGNCDTVCNAYATEWMYQLRRCNGMSDADSIEIRARLIDVCRGNCDAQNPLGGVEFTEVDIILTDVLGSGYANDTCNAIGIVQPVNSGPGTFGMVPMDECACDKVLEAHIQFDTLTATGNLPAGVCSEQAMFTYLYGSNANMANFDQLECYCLQQGYITNDTVVTSSSSGPVTTIIAPNCDAIMNYYTQTYTDSAESYMSNLLHFFNAHWEADSCIDDTLLMINNLGISLDVLKFNCTDNCFTSYLADNILDSAGRIVGQYLTIFNDCGDDIHFGILADDISGPVTFPFDSCTNNLHVFPDGYVDFVGQDSIGVWSSCGCMDSIVNPYGSGIHPFGNGFYTVSRDPFLANYPIPSNLLMLTWTDAFDINAEVTCSSDFDTTMYVPYTLACEQCLNCAMIDTAYMHLVDDYPFIASMDSSDTMQIVQYLNTYINQNYNQNFSVVQLIDQLTQCSASGDPDTLEFCYEPMFANYHNPHEECADFLIDVALSNAEEHYQDYIDSVSASFRDAFIKKCLNAFETFDMEYTEKEFHYTLYYYDQAGNLIKTVPPSGVTVITNTNTLDSVQSYRMNISSTRILPKHKLITDYKYTTLNQPAEQRTPDGGLTKYWYDILGRLVVSQNDQQQNSGLYSYTKYDDLGRIKEVGQVLRNDTAMTPSHAANATYLANWLSVGTKTEVTRTFYDATAISGLTFIGGQKNLINRVAYTHYSNTYNANDTVYDYATHYSYDIHGNVKEVLQENTLFVDQGQQFKKTSYTYDLISGNVLLVSYQAGKKDQFYHKYSYDADNRLITAKTSRENIIWDLDATYIYYKHGPLARVELGDNKVQGIDYAYTIHGWIKGINSNILKAKNDIGADAKTGSSHAKFAADAASYSIGYYKKYTIGSVNYPGDYRSIRSFTADSNFYANDTVSGNVILANQKDLYNGNISYMITTIPNCSTYNASKTLDPDPLGSVYKYDQLNRITQMKAFLDKSSLVSTNIWDNTPANNGLTYFNNYSYDANGNLQKLKRKGDQTGGNLCQDSLSYTYATGGTGYYYGQTLNRLSSISELQTTAARYSGDIDNNSNYGYDDIGNLISDSGEEINTIEWTVYGKVKKVNRSSGSVKSNLEFKYNASGQRIVKVEKPRNSSGVLNQSKWTTTYYVHDAQGNIMSMYTLKYKKITATQFLETMTVSNYILYGSSRLGTKEDTLTLSKRKITVNSWNSDSSFNSITVNTTYSLPALDANHCNRQTGYKEYEVNNHLGNVQATVTDRKVQVSSSPYTTVTSWEPDINTLYDYYPFGAPMPGRNLALAPCSTSVSSVINTVVDEKFTGNTGSFTALSSTISGATNVLVMTKTGASITYGAKRTFTQINGVLYTVSFNLALGNCGGQTITVKVKDPSSGTISTQTYTTAGLKSFTFAATSNGTGSIEFTCPGGVLTCTNFNIDNVKITYQSQSVGTVCASGTDSYMFGFNGKEKLNEAYGEGNAYDFGARIMDPRIGRWLSSDPLESKYPDQSPYSFAGNSPIYFLDTDGAKFVNPYEENYTKAKQDLENADALVNKYIEAHPDAKKGEINKYKRSLQTAFDDALVPYQEVEDYIHTLKVTNPTEYNYFETLKDKEGKEVAIKVILGDENPNNTAVGTTEGITYNVEGGLWYSATGTDNPATDINDPTITISLYKYGKGQGSLDMLEFNKGRNFRTFSNELGDIKYSFLKVKTLKDAEYQNYTGSNSSPGYGNADGAGQYSYNYEDARVKDVKSYGSGSMSAGETYNEIKQTIEKR